MNVVKRFVEEELNKVNMLLYLKLQNICSKLDFQFVSGDGNSATRVEAPSGKEVGSRIDGEVLEMLKNLELMEYEEVFRIERLSSTDIAEMNHEDLRSIGISSVKHRKAIIKYFSGKS